MLDNSNSVALYEQIKLIIKDNIINGVYSPGEQLPNEIQLCEEFSVSRITVRRAIKELSNEGLVDIRQGKGTFVTNEKLNIKILDFGGYTDSLSSISNEIDIKILDKQVVKANKEVADAFKIKEGEDIQKLKRLVLTNGDALSIDIAYFPINIYPDIIDKFHDNVSTYNIIRNDYKITLARAYKEFGVVLALGEYAKLLNCSLSEPLFNIKKTVFDINDRPVHYSTFYIIANKVRYFMNVDMLTKDYVNNNN